MKARLALVVQPIVNDIEAWEFHSPDDFSVIGLQRINKKINNKNKKLGATGRKWEMP